MRRRGEHRRRWHKAQATLGWAYAMVAVCVALGWAGCSSDTPAGSGVSGSGANNGGVLVDGTTGFTSGGTGANSTNAGTGGGTGPGPGRDWDLDSDGDGLTDGQEDLNRDGVYDPDAGETDAERADTDGDGISDGQEDANANGVVDAGESDPRLSDSDGDGLDDLRESELGTDPLLSDTDNDGLTDAQEERLETDPLDDDSDDDGVLDGDEDRNGNGVVDPGETSPTSTDTDGDGIPDGQENTALACAREQRVPVQTLDDPASVWRMIVPEAYATSLDVTLGADGGSDASALLTRDPETGVWGFVLSRLPHDGVTELQDQAARDTTRLGSLGPLLDAESRLGTSWDGAETFHYRAELLSSDGANVTSSALLREAFARWGGVEASAVMGWPEAWASPEGRRHTLAMTVVLRDGRALLVGAIAPTDQVDSDPAVERALGDLSDGSALGRAGDDADYACDPLEAETEAFDVDLLWVVDTSGSMQANQERVAEAAEAFFAAAATTELDFRVAVTSADNRDNLWLIEETGFTRDPATFAAAMLDPPGRAGEFGLATALNVLDRARSNLGESHQRLRIDATPIVVFFSDEDDAQVEQEARDVAACSRDTQPPLRGCDTLQDAIVGLNAQGATAFAITGDAPGGCTNTVNGTQTDEAGWAYIQAALATGGSVGSICADSFLQTFNAILRAAYGVASTYTLQHAPVTSTVKVVVAGREVARNRVNGFDIDANQQSVVFFGSARPNVGDAIAISYRAYIAPPE